MPRIEGFTLGHYRPQDACVLIGQGHGGFLPAGIEVRFSEATALRYLDEADLARYWTSADFPRGHHVLEVLEGGWSWEESELQGYPTQRREWLIATVAASRPRRLPASPGGHEGAAPARGCGYPRRYP